jgi:hypothetical protein
VEPRDDGEMGLKTGDTKGPGQVKSTRHQRIRAAHGNRAQRLTAADRAENVTALAAQGHSVRAISAKMAQLGRPTSKTTVHRILERELSARRDQTQANVATARALDLVRIDRALVGLEPKIAKGDPRAVLALVRVLDRRAKLLGLDAPARVDIRTSRYERMTEDELKAEIEQLQQAVAIEAELVQPATARPVLAQLPERIQ